MSSDYDSCPYPKLEFCIKQEVEKPKNDLGNGRCWTRQRKQEFRWLIDIAL
jgi:hypothetical protein